MHPQAGRPGGAYGAGEPMCPSGRLAWGSLWCWSADVSSRPAGLLWVGPAPELIELLSTV